MVGSNELVSVGKTCIETTQQGTGFGYAALMQPQNSPGQQAVNQDRETKKIKASLQIINFKLMPSDS